MKGFVRSWCASEGGRILYVKRQKGYGNKIGIRENNRAGLMSVIVGSSCSVLQIDAVAPVGIHRIPFQDCLDFHRHFHRLAPGAAEGRALRVPGSHTDTLFTPSAVICYSVKKDQPFSHQQPQVFFLYCLKIYEEVTVRMGSVQFAYTNQQAKCLS